MSNETREEFAENCRKFFAVVSETLETYDDKEKDGLDPRVLLVVAAQLFASTGWGLETEKKKLLSYIADVVDNFYHTDERNDHE